MTVSRRGRWRLLALSFVALLIWIGWSWYATRRHRAAMAAVDAAMASGRPGMAVRELNGIQAWTPHPDEVAYRLGVCEQARGRIRAAEGAWAGVAPGSAFSRHAILARLRLYHDTGRLAEAERLILEAADDPRNDRTYMLVLLVPIYAETGRIDDAERLIEARWRYFLENGGLTPEQSVKLVLLHIELTWRPPPVENLRLYLEQAGRLAPDDDRVWLGKANLALRTGALDEAGRRLDACRHRRPEDVPVWKARLRWAMASGAPAAAQEAILHIPAADVAPAQVHHLHAWLASRRGDVASERRGLERLIAIDPTDAATRDRLIRLATADGQTARAAGLERDRERVAGDLARYLRLYERTQPIRDAEELARLAARLGRRFEARAFLHLASSEEPEREDLRREWTRSEPGRVSDGSPGRSLAQVLASESGADTPIVAAPAEPGR